MMSYDRYDVIWHMTHSTQPSPCIKLLDLPAPNTGRIRILSLDRPAARNAISKQLLHELRTHIDSISSEYASDGSELPPPSRYGGAAGPDTRGPTRTLIIASEVDSSFCAGADLKERAGFTSEEYEYLMMNEPRISMKDNANYHPLSEQQHSSPTSAIPSLLSLSSLSPPSVPYHRPHSAEGSN